MSDADTGRLHAYDAQVRRMAADPDMRGDVLAVGLAMAWLYREEGPVDITMSRIAAAAKLDGPGRRGPAKITPGRNLYLLQEAVACDAPRYEMDIPRVSQCEAPMVRKKGLCGRHPTVVAFSSRDWADGTRIHHAFCRRHYDAGMELGRSLRERDERLRAGRGDPPRPAANTGGVLARHFPGVDWEPVYSWARTGWVPPEQVPATYSAAVPALQLLAGAEEPEWAVGESPTLTVLHGMPDRNAGRRPARRSTPPRRPLRPA